MRTIAELKSRRGELADALARLEEFIHVVRFNVIPLDLSIYEQHKRHLRKELSALGAVQHLLEEIEILKRQRKEKAQRDRLFIQEVINDLIRQNFLQPGDGSKAMELLRDWSRELRDESGLRGRTKRTFFQRVGKHLW